jgi:hypothetical protein
MAAITIPSSVITTVESWIKYPNTYKRKDLKRLLIGTTSAQASAIVETIEKYVYHSSLYKREKFKAEFKIILITP